MDRQTSGKRGEVQRLNLRRAWRRSAVDVAQVVAASVGVGGRWVDPS
jgi:hypothetical protein